MNNLKQQKTYLLVGGVKWQRVTSLNAIKLFNTHQLLVAEVQEQGDELVIVNDNYLFFEKATPRKPSRWVNPHMFIADRFGQAKQAVQDASQGKVSIFYKPSY